MCTIGYDDDDDDGNRMNVYLPLRFTVIVRRNLLSLTRTIYKTVQSEMMRRWESNNTRVAVRAISPKKKKKPRNWKKKCLNPTIVLVFRRIKWFHDFGVSAMSFFFSFLFQTVWIHLADFHGSSHDPPFISPRLKPYVVKHKN